MQYDVESTVLETELSSLIAFRPVTSDLAALRRLLEYVQAELVILGLKTELRKNNGCSYLVAGTKSLDRSRVLLQAHVDVVPAADELFNLKRAGDKLFGRGAYDMLFGTAAFLVALRELKRQGQLAILDIGVILSSDEEVGGFSTAKPAAARYDCAVCFLPDAGEQDALSTSAKGVLQLKLVFNGKSGHAGRPLEYDNPIYKLIDCAAELRLMFPNDQPDQTVCSMTTIDAGEALNQTPETARLTLDIRYVAGDDPEKIEHAVNKLASRHGGVLSRLMCEPAFMTGKNNQHVKEYVSLHERLTKRKMNYMAAPGSSDARFFSAKNIPVIMWRPAGGNLHSSDEWVSLSSLIEFTKILCAYLEHAALPDTHS